MKSKESKLILFLKKYWPLLGYILVSIIFLLPILRQSGVPFKYDWSWPIFNLTEFWCGLMSHGSLGIASIPGKYTSAILGFLGFLRIPPAIALKLFLLLAHIAAGYGFFLFINKKIESHLRQDYGGQAKFISFVAGLAYAFSPYIFIRTITGFISSIIAYAVLPLFFLIYFQPKKKFYYYLVCAFLLILVFSQSQASVLIMLFLLINLLFSANKESFKNFLLTISSLAILILPWYIAGLFVGVGSQLPSGNEVVTLKFIADLPHSLRNILMLSDHHVTSTFFYGFARLPLVVVGFAMVYLIAGFSIFDRKNRSLVLSFFCSSVLILPFSIGPTGKFIKLYTFVFNHFPQIALFRETYHFELLLSFALIFLFAIGVAQIFQRFALGQPGSMIVRSVAILPVLIIIMPYFTFDYVGYFHLQQIPAEYRQANDFFKANKQFCTKAYYPPSLGFIYFKDDPSPDAANSDLIASAFGLPYLTDGSSVLNTASEEMFFRNELTSQFLEQSDNGEVATLMKDDGIDCLIVRTDIATKFYQASNLWRETDLAVRDKWFNQDMLSLAKSKKGLYLEKQFGNNIYIFKIDQNVKIKDQSDNLKFKIDNTTIQQYNKTTMTFLPLTDWANNYAYYKDGWSRGRYDFWRKLIFTQLRQDFIYTDKPESVLLGKIDFEGDYELLTRHLDGGTAGNFEIKIQDTSYKIQKNSGEENFVVKDLGKISVKKGDKVEIKNLFGENAIADMVLVKITE